MPPSSDYVAASDGTGEAVRAIVTTDRGIGSFTLIVDSVNNWPTKFIATSGDLDQTTGLLDENTLTVFKGTLTGSIITIDEFAPGYADNGNTENQIVVLKPSTLWADIVRDYLEELTDYAESQTHIALVKNVVVTGTINGVNTVFTLPDNAVTGTVQLYKNGVRQKPGIGNDYAISGSTITMATAPLTGDVLLADYATNTSVYQSGITGVVTNHTPTGAVNSSNTVFTTSSSYAPGTLEVWINGLKQFPVTHYTETTPASGIFTMSDAPSTGDNIIVNYQHTLASLSDADTVDGYHASTTPAVGSLLALDSNARVPVAAIPLAHIYDADQLYTTYSNIANSLVTIMTTKAFSVVSSKIMFKVSGAWNPNAASGTAVSLEVRLYDVTGGGNTLIVNWGTNIVEMNQVNLEDTFTFFHIATGVTTGDRTYRVQAQSTSANTLDWTNYCVVELIQMGV